MLAAGRERLARGEAVLEAIRAALCRQVRAGRGPVQQQELLARGQGAVGGRGEEEAVEASEGFSSEEVETAAAAVAAEAEAEALRATTIYLTMRLQYMVPPPPSSRPPARPPATLNRL